MGRRPHFQSVASEPGSLAGREIALVGLFWYDDRVHVLLSHDGEEPVVGPEIPPYDPGISVALSLNGLPATRLGSISGGGFVHDRVEHVFTVDPATARVARSGGAVCVSITVTATDSDGPGLGWQSGCGA